MVEIVPIDTPTLGDRSYLVHDGEVALVIDPQRDIDRVLSLAESRRVRITHVFETHIHNDYVTGGRALALSLGAAYHVSAQDPVTFSCDRVADGDRVRVSPALTIEVVATPGHTYHHLSFVLHSEGRVAGVFTGGSLLYGSTGRPDLLGSDHTPELVHAQYHSAHRLARELPDETPVYPTHGFGSFCSSTQTEATSSTIGSEKQGNPVLTQDEQAWVDGLLAGLDAYPAYYAHMGPANLDAPTGAPDLSLPERADADALARRLAAGEWVVDLRTRTAFAAGHLKGSLSFGLDGAFATYLGWLIPWGTPVTLLGESVEQVAEAQRELVRVGIDRPAAAATGTAADWSGLAPPERLRIATFAELRAERANGDIFVLDVRRGQEWREDHVPDSLNIPLHQLLDRLHELPSRPIWVHCETGYRSSIGASILVAAGKTVVAIDDEFDNARRQRLTVSTAKGEAAA